MSKINILSEDVANKIAAGEVIERPASVVKELVENSIDAGATKITISIIKAGSKEISVIDNGSGMDSDDALLCLEPHATSKIKTAKDINNILTLGFRGEAIPSIASIAKFHLKTRQKDTLEGTEVIVHGGKFIATNPIGCSVGTEITIKDIFYNIPARKKFLKTQATEERHIHETLLMIALCNPNIFFEFISDGRIVFSSPAHEDLYPRLALFFGKEYSANMLQVLYEETEIKVHGYVANHGYTRSTRREQRTFVNGRPVQAISIYEGIKDGYLGTIDKGRFPPVVLFIEVPAYMVDINVHPAKREVRFQKELLIRQAVAKAISNKLRTSSTPTASISNKLSIRGLLNNLGTEYTVPAEQGELDLSLPKENKSVKTNGGVVRGLEPPKIVQTDRTPQKDELIENSHTPNESSIIKTVDVDCVENIEPNTVNNNNGVDVADSCNEEIKVRHNSVLESKHEIIGVLDDTYIIATSENGLVLIDQHAAHERVMFEKLKRAADSELELSQSLLLPVTLELSLAEVRFIDKNLDSFKMVGFDIEKFSENTVMVNSIPNGISQNNIVSLFKDILDNIFDNGILRGKCNYDDIAMASCKAAVKAHDKLNMIEARKLMEDMAQCELPFSCPHGRPTIINITISELERRFGRK
jgi:DNA mismatch repair protein MutL